jgi:hypothetical protein
MASKKSSSSTSSLGDQYWQQEYDSVLLEKDNQALFRRVEIAEARCSVVEKS